MGGRWGIEKKHTEQIDSMTILALRGELDYRLTGFKVDQGEKKEESSGRKELCRFRG